MDEYQKRSQQEVARLQVGLKSLLIIPLVWQTGVHGVLTFRAFEPAAFGEHEIEFAWQVANQIAGAISASNQYSKLESESRERERLAEEQLRTAEIGRMVSSTLDLDDVFSAFVEQAAHLVPLDRVVTSLVNSDGETIKDAFISGQSIENNVKESVIA
ncbi:MAG TPA: GAF domain-containing protein, partial [Dehalococcoidia bacterium]|nr:GAF domain-containing protein [Dehalococcoidia bacterium]